MPSYPIPSFSSLYDFPSFITSYSFAFPFFIHFVPCWPLVCFLEFFHGCFISISKTGELPFDIVSLWCLLCRIHFQKRKGKRLSKSSAADVLNSGMSLPARARRTGRPHALSRSLLPAHSAWGSSLHPGPCDAEALASCPLEVARRKYRRAAQSSDFDLQLLAGARALFTSGGSGGGERGERGGGGSQETQRKPLDRHVSVWLLSRPRWRCVHHLCCYLCERTLSWQQNRRGTLT